MLWINITPLFCVYKAPLAPSVVNGIIPHTSYTFNSQQVMSPETCQKRYSFQQSHQRNNLRPSHRSNSSLKSRKSCQSNELSNLPNHTKHYNSSRNRRRQSPAEKAGETSQDQVSIEGPHDHPISTNIRREITKSPIRSHAPALPHSMHQ
jgi:hypothetical protein